MAKKRKLTPVDQATTLDAVIKKYNDQLGDNTMSVGTEVKDDPFRVPFGVFALDFATGGGIPVYGTACLWGGNCLSGDTKIRVTTVSKANGKHHSDKVTTLKRLYERLNRIPVFGKGQYHRRETEDALYLISSVNEEGVVIKNLLIGAIHSGIKECSEVTTKKGFSCIATGEHEFLTPRGFRKLKSLRVGSSVFVHNGGRRKGEHKKYKKIETIVKYHPFAPIKKVNGITYYRIKTSRLIIEAEMNKMSFEDFRLFLNTQSGESIDKLHFLSREFDVHHIDHDETNNSRTNLEVLVKFAHYQYHATMNAKEGKFGRVVEEDSIVSVEPVGKIETYDLQCAYPHNNFIANGIVVHNSGGKTGIASNAARAVSAICWRCFNPLSYCSCSQISIKMRTFVADAEGTFDMGWAKAIGNNPDDLVIGRGEYGEQYVNLAENALRASDCGLVIFDSLAGLTPLAEFEAPSEDQFYASQARLITRCVRKLKQRLIREMKIGHPCSVLFINQLRFKIGAMGDPETMTGGEGMKHEFSLLIRCAKKSLARDGVDKKYLEVARPKDPVARHSFTVRKNKVFTLESGGEYVRVLDHIPELNLKKGSIDDSKTVLSYAREQKVVTKKEKGDGYRYFDHSAKTLDDIQKVLRRNYQEYLRTSKITIDRAKEARLADYTEE
jgi:RecA/RadA recombinase